MYVRFEYTPYKEIYIPGVLSGLNPTSRYINKTYLMSTLPIISDNGNNALEGYKGIKNTHILHQIKNLMNGVTH